MDYSWLSAPAGQVPETARTLLGWEISAGGVRIRLTEVEAYAGTGADPASHAHRGPTPRTRVMFGPAGHAYTYFVFGVHWCLNVVCGGAGEAAAVLLRAGEVVDGADLARERRAAGADTRRSTATDDSREHRATGPVPASGTASADDLRERPAAGPAATSGAVVTDDSRERRVPDRDLARGPARLVVALGITAEANGTSVVDGTGPLLLTPPTRPVPPSAISAGPRVGVAAAHDVPWRFWITGDPTVSVYRRHVPRRRPRA
ncbi:DNA-3-methyladenine glycosylase [Micromonospora cathayae]|uniref:Putative 3-methyladenine DNA glycosylase n=1 Tax=Micromonospora cathayae TaxID=3028804 RepID=A0ABY7ZHY3_9ACTN|nr:DNA-3-methyladenine glycosylase [Micromonospora sp. HUAS 3]WDZ82381.1 DNA-3-methyladenine glycosylase [Micromonospora sp. HUAS 3]